MTWSILEVYERLYKHFGHLGWWPAKSPFEVIVGAILTQQTSWKNVEKAISNLEKAGKLSIEGIATSPISELERLIYPTGFYKQKAVRLSIMAKHLYERYDADLTRFFSRDKDTIREELLSIHGIGKETADSILLYAGEKLSFVVDAYTMRLLERLPINVKKSYDAVQEYFESHLPSDINIYKEFHALIVELGKNYCRTNPRCQLCPLRDKCSFFAREEIIKTCF